MKRENLNLHDADEQAGISLREVAAPLFRRKGLLVITFLAIVTGALVILAIAGPWYRSHMAILVSRERLDPLVSTEATTQVMTATPPVTAEEVNSELELLRSRDILEKVVIANGLNKPRGWFSLSLPWESPQDKIEKAVKKLARKLDLKVMTKTNMIDVRYTSSDPQLAHDVLQSLGEFYSAKHIAVHRPAGSYELFSSEADRYRADLENAEAKLRSLVDGNSSAAAPDDQRTSLATQFGVTVGLLYQAQQAVAADEARIGNDEAQLQTTSARSATSQSSAFNDKAIGDLTQALLAAETKRIQLSFKYASDYPLVIEANEEAELAKQTLLQAEQKKYLSETTDRDPTYELVREDLARTQADLAAQRATVAAANRSIGDIQGLTAKLDGLSISRSDLVREVKAAESNYLLYLAKREQERTANALDKTRIENIAIAVPPGIPALPVIGWGLMTVLVLVGGALFSAILAYIADYIDPSFHTPEQVVQGLHIPTVVAIPRSA